MFHRSDRLLLRPIWPEDWQGVLAGIADKDVVRNLASAPWPYGEDDARQFTSLAIDPAYPRFLMTRAEDATVVGCIGIDALPDGEAIADDAVEMGYWVARPYWGQGFATEAGSAVLQIARTLGYRNVVASHFTDNPASGSVLRKLGFSPTGRVVERHSCGRGESAHAVEFLRELEDEIIAQQRAA